LLQLHYIFLLFGPVKSQFGQEMIGAIAEVALGAGVIEIRLATFENVSAGVCTTPLFREALVRKKDDNTPTHCSLC